MTLGVLIIQNRKRLSDGETVNEIIENPYMQYFIGLSEFIQEPPFDPSLMVHFRKRLGKDIIHEVNEIIAKEQAKCNDPPLSRHKFKNISYVRVFTQKIGLDRKIE